jgi:hypothetical protein
MLRAGEQLCGHVVLVSGAPIRRTASTIDAAINAAR